MDELSQVDLAFCVDLTRSMEPFIALARNQMVLILGGLRASARADLRVAIAGYRDHDPNPEERTVELYPFTASDDEVKRVLYSLRCMSAPSNTDAAEAVFAGLAAAMKHLDWRPHAFRVVVLIGDAPPHACGANAQPFPDRFPHEDPTGFTTSTLGNALESAGLFVHAIGMIPSNIPVHDPVLQAAFSRIAGSTGGTYRNASGAEAAISVVLAIGRAVFGQMSFDRELYTALMANTAQPLGPVVSGRSSPAGPPPPPGFFAPGGAPPPAAAPAPMPNASSEEVQAAMARLKKRGLLS